MKTRITIAITFVLLSATSLSAQKISENIFEFMGGFGKTSTQSISSNVKSDDYIPSFSFTWTYKFSQNFGLGAGTSYDGLSMYQEFDGGKAISGDITAWSIFADVRGYIPIDNHISLVGVVDIGDSILFANDNGYLPSNVISFTPQLGMKFTLSEKCNLALNLRAYYKYMCKVDTNIWGAMVGLSF